MNIYTTQDLGKYAGPPDYCAKYMKLYQRDLKEIDALKQQIRDRKRQSAGRMEPYFRTPIFSYEYTRKMVSQMVKDYKDCLNWKMINRIDDQLEKFIQKPINLYLCAKYKTSVLFRARLLHLFRDQGRYKSSEIRIHTLVFEIIASIQGSYPEKKDDRKAISELGDLLNLYFGTDHMDDLYDDMIVCGDHSDRGNDISYFLDCRRVVDKKGEDLTFYMYNDQSPGQTEDNYVMLDPETLSDDIISDYVPLYGVY